MNLLVRVAVALTLVVSVTDVAGAQLIPQRAPPMTDSARRAKADSARRDSIRLAPPDSVMRALMARMGYSVTRYQGDSVTFDATTRGLLLYGKPAIVVRDKMEAAGTTIAYDELLHLVRIDGSPGRVHDPSRGEDIIAYKPITYDLANRRGKACSVQTSASSGFVWYIAADCSGFVSDTAGGVVYARGAHLSTDSSVIINPDSAAWRFEIGQMKQRGKSLIVGTPAKLYIGEVPVLWIPWFVQDMRKGRRSGILTPRFGVAELVRNSPTYRRTVDNLGVYFALSDYYDAEVSLDWRSGARPRIGDPGWLRLNGNLRYAWASRFINGNIGVGHMRQNDGLTNTSFTWQHSQSFSQKTRLNANLNYVTSTTVQRQTTLNPYVAVATIGSQLNYQTQFGPLQTSLGGSMRQFPGREEIDIDAPSLNITSKPIQLGEHITWTPSLNVTNSQSLHMDSPSEFGFKYTRDPSGALDSAAIDRSTRTTSVSYGTPLKIWNFTISASARYNDRLSNAPEARIVIDPVDTANKRTVVYERTYFTTIDYDVGMNLPQLLQGSWNLTPNVTVRNVDGSGYCVRSERTGADFVCQSKRLSYGLSVSPTFYRLFNVGLGPFSRFRHSLSPSVSYSYSPEATVSNEFLAAIGRTRPGYLGALAQNRVSLSLTQVIEAKRRPPVDSADATAASQQSVRLLSITFTPVEYDFERARVTGRSGFSTDRFSYTVRSDLLPGFDFAADYSLFDAPSISDTANFKPYLEGIRASLSLGGGQGSGGLGFFARILSWLTGERADPKPDSAAQAAPSVVTGTIPGQSPGFMAGRSRPSLVDVPTGQGFRATLTLSSQHPRPPRGGNVIAVDPRERCEPFRTTSPLQYDICVRQQAPLSSDPTQQLTTGGGVVFRYPNQTSLNGTMSFNLTKNWAAQWQAMYDAEKGEFATQIISLQRDMGDWRSIFGFSQASNGNFSFNFLISLKPAPDLKLNYDRQSYRSSGPGN